MTTVKLLGDHLLRILQPPSSSPVKEQDTTFVFSLVVVVVQFIQNVSSVFPPFDHKDVMQKAQGDRLMADKDANNPSSALTF